MLSFLISLRKDPSNSSRTLTDIVTGCILDSLAEGLEKNRHRGPRGPLLLQRFAKNVYTTWIFKALYWILYVRPTGEKKNANKKSNKIEQ